MSVELTKASATNFMAFYPMVVEHFNEKQECHPDGSTRREH